MKVSVYNQKGDLTQEIELNDQIFGQKFNSQFIHQIYTKILSNRRQPIASTKDRSEVKGGGRKPWPQKGTGRARHSSIRSPLWKGGGITFGPRQKERNFKKKINRKENKIALSQILSQKLKDKEIIIVENLEIEKTKTKEIYSLLNNLIKKEKGKPFKKTILLIESKDKEIKRISRNIPSLKVMTVESIDLLELLNCKYLILKKDILPLLEKLIIK